MQTQIVFPQEEQLVSTKFFQDFRPEIELFFDILRFYEKLIRKVVTKPDEYDKYCAAILAGHNIKSFNSAFDRLAKGYLGDSEAIFKKIIEAFLAEIYFYEHTDKAKKWAEGATIEKLSNRAEIAKLLDKINAAKKIFPTDLPNFFEEYIYKVGYVNSNKVAHLDFDFVHWELGLEKDQKVYATTLVIGPKYEYDFMKTTLNRLIMFCMFQVSYLKDTFNISYDEYSEIFGRVREKFFT